MLPDWYSLIQTVATATATGLVISLHRAFSGGKYVAGLEARLSAIDKEQALQRALIEDAGGKMSTLASTVNGLPSRWQTDCLTRRESDMLLTESREHRDRLQRDIERLWAAVHTDPRH